MLKQNRQDYRLDLNKKLNIAHINVCTEAEGPYKRMAIWFQGCDILCEGCCNPELQEIRVAHIMTVQDVIEIALEAKRKHGIEGVTLLGGEPTLQDNLGILVSELRRNDFGIILFTGRCYDSLEKELMVDIDMVIDGRFKLNEVDNNRNMIGSKNQAIICISERYKKDVDWFMNTREKRVEINMNDSIFITGDALFLSE